MKKLTSLFIGLIIVMIAIYDVFAIMKGGTEESISYVIILWSYEYPAFTFCMGFTMGHLFWRVRNVKGTDKLGQ